MHCCWYIRVRIHVCVSWGLAMMALLAQRKWRYCAVWSTVVKLWQQALLSISRSQYVVLIYHVQR